MVDIYIISDTHLRHQNIYKFTDRFGNRIRPQFTSAEEGDAYMIQAWNDTVKPTAHVWHLGDFCMAGPEHWIGVGKRLNGHKRLVLGNHDIVQHVSTFKDAGFQKVQGAKELQIAGLRMLCTHYPVHESSLFKRDCNVHGHIHQNNSPSLRHYNVSVEKISYRPIHVEDLAKRVRLQLAELETRGDKIDEV